jgi:hypothetical protein
MPAEDNQPQSIASPFGTPNNLNGDTQSGSAFRKRKTESPNGVSAPAQMKAMEKRSAPTRSASEIFAAGVGKGGEGARGRLWVCDVSGYQFDYGFDSLAAGILRLSSASSTCAHERAGTGIRLVHLVFAPRVLHLIVIIVEL